MDALVSGWLKPIFLRFPVGFADEPPLLALVLVLVVPHAASTGPATASVAPARPTRLVRLGEMTRSAGNVKRSAGDLPWSGSRTVSCEHLLVI